MLEQLIADMIRSEGPIPFERFMEIALYHPSGGFFQTVRSNKEGDFLTSPEVSPLFGRTIARFVARQHQRVGDPFVVVEAGAGSGSLLGPLLTVEAVEAWAVELSAEAREALRQVVGLNRVVSQLAEIPSPFTGVIVANELLDNLPMAIAQRKGDSWRERWIGLDPGERPGGSGRSRLTMVDADPRDEVVDWLDRFAGPVEDGGWVEVQLAVQRWVAQAVGMLRAGAVVIVDYGDTADKLAPRRRAGTLRTYSSHHLGPDPLHEPGSTDITADVNLTAVMAAAESAGAAVTVWRQDDFLIEHGLRDTIDQLRDQESELARAGLEMERLGMRTLRTEAETLLHPRGLGDFRVVVAEM